MPSKLFQAGRAHVLCAKEALASRLASAPRCRLSLPLAACLLLAGCLEDLEHPAELRFDDANVPEVPEPVQFTARNLSDEAMTVRLSSWAPDWLTPAEESVTIGPGGTATVEVDAAACEEGGEREGALAVSAGGGTALVRVAMNCIAGPDARFGDVAAHQGARVGPTEFNLRLEIPVVNDRPGAFRAEVLANFEPSAPIEVEAAVLNADGEPVAGISPLARLRAPIEFDHDEAAYAAVHEFEAPSAAFAEDVEVVLRIDPDGRLLEDHRGNNEARPLAGAPRLPEPLPSFVFHLLAVNMTIVKDGEEHALSAGIPNCPAGCLAGALDMLPLPVDLVEVSQHAIDIGTLEWTDNHANERWGMAMDVRARILDGIEAEGILVGDVPIGRQMAIAFVAHRESINWNNNAFAGLSGMPIITVERQATGYERLDEFRYPSTVAHEIGHNFSAFHSWPKLWDSATCSVPDPDFPYGADLALISGDPDGDGPLRVRPAYARLGSAGQVEPVYQYSRPQGFIDQALPLVDVMDCGQNATWDEINHVSDYHYLLTLFGAGSEAGLPWVEGSCLEWRHSQGYVTWRAADAPCPWRRIGDPVGIGVRAKSAAAPIPSSPAVFVSGHVGADGRFMALGAYAKRGDWPRMRQAADGDHVLIAYDANGVAVHEQPIRLHPAFHLAGVRGRYEAVVPRADAVRVELRDGDGSLLLSLDVAQ